MGDSSGYIASGVQSAFKDDITGYSLVDGVYNLKRYGKGNDIKLTLNAEICKVAYEALKGYKGTVGVMNYKTGELICIVSTPTFDVYNKPEDIYTDTSGKYEGIYMNRFFSGLYTPGSTFKVITAASAIENIPDIYEQEFVCKGKIQVGEGYVVSALYADAVHGIVDMLATYHTLLGKEQGAYGAICTIEHRHLRRFLRFYIVGRPPRWL